MAGRQALRQQFPLSPNMPIASPRSDARTVETAAKFRLHDRIQGVSGNCWRYEGRLDIGDLDYGQLVSGILTWPDGRRYEGKFDYGLPHDDQGVLTWPDGRRYEGKIGDGELNSGVLTWPDGKRYEGDFRDGQPYGQGVKTWPEGVYSGRVFHRGERRE